MDDPFPGQLLLDRFEVRRALGYSSRMAWKRFMDSEDGKRLPQPVDIAGTEKWHKSEVLAFILMLKRTQKKA